MKQQSLLEILQNIYLFSSLSSNELEQLARICSTHHYKKDATLFMKGEQGEHLLILVDGLLSVYKHDDKGNEIIIGLFNKNSLIAEPAILKEIPFPSTAVFKSDGTIIKIKLDEFRKTYLQNAQIAQHIIESLLGKIQLLQNNIHMNIASTAKEKILNFYEKNYTLDMQLKKYEIASLLGMTPETFSRNVKQLEKEGKLKN